MHNLLSGRRVLVVEDEMMILIMIEGMLADLGCEAVTAAATVDQAIACIDAQDFDAAMLDLNLDGANTYPVADVLAARGVPFFFSTGYANHGSEGQHGDRPVLRKPFQYEDLAAILTRLLPAPAPA